ncbi:hypothetical protein KEJ43_05330 [Candidatus Bathyarchaeota archaeon]|nr:hypothetical protein [Candidatus Bathyarchaeota archaeon]
MFALPIAIRAGKTHKDMDKIDAIKSDLLGLITPFKRMRALDMKKIPAISIRRMKNLAADSRAGGAP